ncbi:alpha/beta hydrolase [Sphingomonas sp. MS122]|uniref:alpha/beta hydrolase n=1 Tax=Sphingomonas sp. MS122 TaxID=3412683 RepID=UPI003C2CE2DC
MTEIFRTPVLIPAEGGLLAGRLHRNVADLLAPQPGIVASGSWLTVKEQMADGYAAALAARGYTVLTFDFAGWGESGGGLPQVELPLRKASDIVAATQFLRSLSCVRGGEVGYLAICASAMYACAAIDRGAPIGALASVAGWFHDTATVSAFYGGPVGVADRIGRAAAAVERFRETGDHSLVPAYDEGNDRAGMFIHMDYYASPLRGRIPAWRNEMSEISWLHWLTFDGLRAARSLELPTLFVHGDECALPENLKQIHAAAQGPKELVWQPGFQVDFYDRPDLVELAVAAADTHYRRYLGV